MPSTYLCRGFRWHREAIRLYVMMNDLELCAPDWILGWETSEHLLKSLHAEYEFLPLNEGSSTVKPKPTKGILKKHHPDPSPPKPRFVSPATRKPRKDDFVLRHHWSNVYLLEEYDETDTTQHCRPYAFVADYVVRVELDVDVNEEMGKMGTMLLKDDHAWFEKLNQKLQPEENIKWYIVVIADELRSFDLQEEAREEPERASGEEELSRPNSNGTAGTAGTAQKKKWTESVREKVRERGSIRNLFKKKTEQDMSEQADQPEK